MPGPLVDLLGPWQIPAGHVFHVAFAVDDVASAMTDVGRVLQLAWTPIRDAEVVFESDGGRQVTPIQAVYSRQGPPYFELVSGPAGSFFEGGATAPRLHHAGYFVDDVAAEVRRLEALGLAAHGIAPGTPPRMAMVNGPLGFALEIFAPAVREVLLDWFAKG